jgi:hypothetical protein
MSFKIGVGDLELATARSSDGTGLRESRICKRKVFQVDTP